MRLNTASNLFIAVLMGLISIMDYYQDVQIWWVWLMVAGWFLIRVVE